MIDPGEFNEGWALLQAAMPETEIPEATRELYRHGLSRDLEAGAFVAGVLSLICGAGFDNRRVPTMHELREAGRGTARPEGEPYVGGVPLRAILGALRADGGPEPGKAEAPTLVAKIIDRTPAARRELGPGSAGHKALLARTVAPMRRPSLAPGEWERRRRELVEQGEELIGGEGDS